MENTNPTPADPESAMNEPMPEGHVGSVPGATPVITENEPTGATKEAFEKIAEKVRGDSRNLAQLTHVEELGPLFPEKKPDEIFGDLARMMRAPQYQDVRLHVSASGAGYLYSETYIESSEASEKALIEEVQEGIASRVRTESQAQERPTPLKAIAEQIPDVPPEKIEQIVARMAADARFQDIEMVVGPTGMAYLYCATHITSNYATLFARAESKNPYVTIAETVREESRIYPRPTQVKLFQEPPFLIDAGIMQTVIEGLLRREEYKDIKKFVASTGTIYLYSDLFLPARQAEAIAQWEEVERQQNP